VTEPGAPEHPGRQGLHPIDPDAADPAWARPAAAGWTPDPPEPIAPNPPAAPDPPAQADELPPSAWITTAPEAAPASRGIGGRILGSIGAIVLIVVVGGFIASAIGLLPNDKGKVLFGTAAGSGLCSVGNAGTAVTTTDPIFFAAVLRHHMDGDQAITFVITRNGADYVTHEEPADGSEFDCYGNSDSLGALEPGTYVFEVHHNGEVEATGTLTVT
jgi:hypothetical protein